MNSPAIKVVKSVREQVSAEDNGELAWPAMLRKLDRLDTSYRN